MIYLNIQDNNTRSKININEAYKAINNTTNKVEVVCAQLSNVDKFLLKFKLGEKNITFCNLYNDFLFLSGNKGVGFMNKRKLNKYITPGDLRTPFGFKISAECSEQPTSENWIIIPSHLVQDIGTVYTANLATNISEDKSILVANVKPSDIMQFSPSLTNKMLENNIKINPQSLKNITSNKVINLYGINDEDCNNTEQIMRTACIIDTKMRPKKLGQKSQILDR